MGENAGGDEMQPPGGFLSCLLLSAFALLPEACADPWSKAGGLSWSPLSQVPAQNMVRVAG